MSVKTASKTRTLVILAMLCAMAFILTAVGRIPVVLFLKYDPKDIVIAIGGFLFGPLAALSVSVVTSIVEMLTLSDTGVIGLVMNILSSASFACVAAAIYQKKRTMRGALAGLAVGIVSMTAIMLLWNYLITPLYMHVERAQVAALLVPAFLPFNLVKGFLNAAATLLLYKPVVSGLTRAHMIAPSAPSGMQKKNHIAIVCAAAFVIATCVLCMLAMQGKL